MKCFYSWIISGFQEDFPDKSKYEFKRYSNGNYDVTYMYEFYLFNYFY